MKFEYVFVDTYNVIMDFIRELIINDIRVYANFNKG